MDTFNFIICISAGILTILNLIDKLIMASNKAKEPMESIERRLSELERKTDEEYKKILDGYDKRIADIETSNKKTMKAILALLKHSIDGNNKSALEEATKDLSDYLVEK